MEVITTCDQARRRVWELREKGRTVGLVPTMGALHDGHMSLVQQSTQICDATIVSIFVNPAQFAPYEDLGKYPRTFVQDCELLDSAGVSLVFAPTVDEMYPAGFSTYLDPPDVALPLEGVCRPGHFRGVATVVMKLFQALPATHAIFGSKDYQQLKVVEALVADINVGIEVIAGETVREADGLALSSRNRYLSDEERKRALALSSALETVERELKSGQSVAGALEYSMHGRLASDVDTVDYAVVVDAQTLEPLSCVDRPAVALIAAYVGKTRLIDNRRLDP